MFDLTIILPHSLIYGFIYSALLAGLILFSLWYNPEMWHQDYPEAVKAKFGPMSQAAKRERFWFSLLFFPVAFGFPLLAVGKLGVIMGNVGFAAAFLTVFIVFLIFNLVDLIIIDWLIAVYWQPARLILPGTADMPEYRDYGFHFRAFLKGLLFCPIMGLVLGGVGSLIW